MYFNVRMMFVVASIDDDDADDEIDGRRDKCLRVFHQHFEMCSSFPFETLNDI